MRKNLSRLLALVLAVSISLNSLPLSVWATNSEPVVPETPVVEEIIEETDATPEPEATAEPDAAEEPEATAQPEETQEPDTAPTQEPDNTLNVGSDEVSEPEPTETPVEPTVEPTAEPTVEPTAEPTAEPTVEPTAEPTVEPTTEPVEETEDEKALFTVTDTAAMANGDATVVIAGSDYQNTNGGRFSSGASTDTYAIMSRIKADYEAAYGFLFGGDYYAHGTYTTTESTNGKNQLKNEIVDVLYTDMADDTQIYIQGNHDAGSLTTNGTLATSGAHDTDYYGVYVINEKDYMWYNNDQATIKNTASALESYLDAKLDEGYDKPIFVLSHLPLHYSNRTIKEGDGKYAKYIYDVLDEAGENDLNIIFMYGHNHSTSYYEEYLGNAAVYLAEGDTIYIANEGSQSSCFSDTLDFTYMNYGFTGYLTGTAADGALTMTVFEIYEDEVQVKRYDKEGVHNLKSAGTNGSTPSGASVNATVYTSPQTITLETPEERVTFTDNGVTVTAAGITAITAEKAEAPTYNSSLYSGYEEYTVSAEGYETGKTADVTIALTDGDFDTTRAITVKFPDGHTEDVAVVNGTITFETDALGTFTLMQKVQTEIEIPGDGGSSDTGNGTIWRQVTSFTAGKNYMLVVYGDNASGVGNFAVNSTAGGTAVTVKSDSTGAYIENSDMALAWVYNSNAELTNASTGQYLYINGYPSGTNGITVGVINSVTTGTSYSSWKLAQNTALGETSLSAYRNGFSNYYPVRWSNSDQHFLAYTSTQTSKHDNWIAIFEQTSEGGSSSGGSNVDTSGGDWVTITKPSGGTTTYTYTQATSITAGGKYVIVGNSNAVALMDNNGSMGEQNVTISGSTMTSTTQLTEWTFSGSDSGIIYNGTRYLRYNNLFSLNENRSTTFTFTDNGSNFRIQSGNYSFYYNGSSWTRSDRNAAQYVRLYQLTDTTTTGGTAGFYGKLDGELEYTVPYGTSEAVALQKVKDGIAIKYATASDYSDEATYADDGEGMTWEVVNYDGNTAGEYAVNISYNGKLLGTAKIIVNAKPAGTAQVTINSDSGTVRQNAGAAALTGNKLTLTYENGTTETVNVTVAMVRNAGGTVVDTSVPGTYTGLKVVYTYNGVEYTICENYTLTVRENVQNNYPEYPDEGAVKVNKTATGIDFQSSGIAQVELSASGVPSKKGVDVIVMVDTSSSMKRGAGTNSEVSAPNRRIDFLQVALANLIREFQAVGDDGEQLDINVAIAEFNGYQFISGEDAPSDSSQQGASNVAEVFTGDGSKTAGAFVQASSIVNPDTFAENIGAHSGTNYDYAFDTVYRLGSAINTQNESNGEDRDLFVIFMSDGAPYGYNYYGSGTTDTWDDYLNGNMTLNANGRIVDDTGVYLKGNTHFYRTDGKHWMAEAVKGTTDQTYMVIDPTDSLGTDATAADVKVYEDAGIILTEGETSYFRMVPGLGAEVHTIGFCLYDDNQGNGDVVYATTQKNLMQRLASVDKQGNTLYHETESGSDLNDIFCTIASQIAYAANNARFVDQMGDNFNLQMKTSTYKTPVNGVEVEKTLAPVIEIGTYSIYTRQNYLDGLCTEDQIGDRTGKFTLTEVVKFNEDGTKAYSNLIDVDGDGIYGVTVDSDGTYTISDTDDNILGTDGVIYAKSFMYNTGVTAVTVKGVTIESEQFYWKIGTIETKELAMRYYVYLEGSMEGTKEAGSYATNEYAILYYDNYLGNACEKPTVSPTVAWKSANVSYAFYLVNENGDIIVNQTTGQTGTFANKISITNPVVYEEILLNNTDQVNSIDVRAISDDVLPKYYTLYDESAVYEVTINSNSTGSWEITKGNGKVNSTYVTHYKVDNASAYSNALTNNTIGDDYTHTTVWFAVVWKVGAHPDSVVIDYGLPVDISVLTNDMFGENGKLEAVGPYTTDLEKITAGKTLPTGFGKSYTGDYGTAKADTATGKVRYTLDSMEMNGYEEFAYAVNFTGTTGDGAGYYYDTITVIPATTIYFEDSFVGLESYTWTSGWTKVEKEDERYVWSQDGTAVDGVQGEDRPGKYSLSDANNIYGFDGANNSMSTYSMGSAMKAAVDYDNYGLAQFDFYGTGFDVISMTSATTGVIYVDIYQNGELLDGKSYIVDTYYGYHQVPGDGNGDGTVDADEMKWEVNPEAKDSIYQVPVIKIENLPYGKYTAKITAFYSPAYDNVDGSTGYDFYLDAIRIYDPAGDGVIEKDNETDTTIQDAYLADGEAWPSYIELRDGLIKAESFDELANDVLASNKKMEGLVFIDGDASVGNADIADYISYGPNNEVYLAPGQRVAFMLKTPDNIANIHLGVKLASGVAGTYTITNIAAQDRTVENITVTAGTYYSAKTSTVDTATEMYYDITDYKGDIIVVSNTGNLYNTDGIVSITNIKSTYKTDPRDTVTDWPEEETAESTVAYTSMYMTPAAAALTLRTLNAPVEDVQPVPTPEETPEPTPEVTPTPEPEETPEVSPTPTPEEDKKPNNNKPDKEEKPSKPDKEEKPSEPDKEEKPSKPEKEEKPSKPDKEENSGNNKSDKTDKENNKNENKPANNNNNTVSSIITTIVNSVINFVTNLLSNLFKW